MNRYALRDDQWSKSNTCCPANPVMSASPPTTIADSSKRCSYRYRTGIPWRDLPERFGDWKNTHKRFNRWAHKGVWQRLLDHLAAEPDNEYAMIDSTIVRAHRTAPAH